MFKIKQDPTFSGSIKLISMGREQTLNVTFRSKTRTEYAALCEGTKDNPGSEIDVFLALVEKWDADEELNRKSVEELNDHQPLSVWHVINAYGECLLASRKGN